MSCLHDINVSKSECSQNQNKKYVFLKIIKVLHIDLAINEKEHKAGVKGQNTKTNKTHTTLIR